VKYFTIETQTSTTGFQEHVRIDLTKSIGEQVIRRKLRSRAGPNHGNTSDLRKIIEHNASLRVDFGWSFESAYCYEQIMNDCIVSMSPRFGNDIKMTSDNQCSWLGFLPLNCFERITYETLSVYDLILYNNNLITLQIDIINFITSHEIYRQHAILRDDRYRFAKFKEVRKNPVELADAYCYYIKAVHDICQLVAMPRDLLEEQIGCHFIGQSDLFFELLAFSILKGEIYDD
jgi:hypothetical protein